MPSNRDGWKPDFAHANAVAQAVPAMADHLTVWRRGDLLAIVNRHPFGTTDDVRWHISVSGAGRLATWDEMVHAAHHLRPGVPFCIGIPPQTWWMNHHPYVLHLWQTKDEGLVSEWRLNARGDRPT